MSTYQRIVVSTGQPNGAPGPLPRFLEGLKDTSLANLPAVLDPGAIAQLGLEDTGFLPVADPPGPAPRSVTRVVFVRRISTAKRQAIRTARATDALVDDIWEIIQWSELINLDDPDVIAAVGVLRTKGLINVQDVTNLLA